MSKQHGERGDHHPRRAFLGEPACKPHRCRTLRGVEHQRENSRQRARNTRHVGCADVAAAGFAHVRGTKQFC